MDVKRLSGRTILVAAIILLFLLAPVVAVVAQEWMSSADPEYVPPAEVQGEQIIGDDPDEDGYQGPVLPGEAVGEPSGDGEVPEWQGAPQDSEPQPDEDAYYEGASIDNQINVTYSNFYYLHVAGSTLTPRVSSSTWASSTDGGCLYATANAGEVWNQDAQLPNGARIDYLRIYYYDTNASNSQSWITRYDDAGGIFDIASAASTGTGGYGTVLSDYVGAVVDNVNYSYVLNYRPIVVGNSMQLCGLRLAYRLPLD